MKKKTVKKRRFLIFGIALMLLVYLCGCQQTSGNSYYLPDGQPNAPVESDGGWAIRQGDYIYFLNGDNYVRNDGLRLHSYRGAICRMNADGTDIQLLCDDDVSVFNLKGDTIWYVAYKNKGSYLYSIKIDGTGKKQLAAFDNIFDGGYYAYSADRLYFTQGGCLYAVDPDGANKQKLTDYRVCNLMADNTNLYFTQYQNEEYGNLYKLAHGDTEPQEITESSGYMVATTSNAAYYYLFTNGYCYRYDPVNDTSVSVCHLGYEEYCFSNQTDYIFVSYLSEDKESGIFRINTDGTRSKLCDDAAERMVYHDGYVYYINDSALYSLYRVSVDGKTRECIANNMISSIDRLDIVGDWLYYFNDDDESRIYRINLNNLYSFCIEYEDMSKG